MIDNDTNIRDHRVDSARAGSYAPPMNDMRALQLARDNFVALSFPSKYINQESLRAALRNPSLSPELKTAAAYLLNHPALFNKTDVAAHGGSADGDISKNDLDTEIALRQYSGGGDETASPDVAGGAERVIPSGRTSPINESQAMRTVLANFDKIVGRGAWGLPKSTFTREDLRAALRNPELSPRIKEACAKLLNDSSLFDKIDTAGHGGDKDGHISKDDLKTQIELQRYLPEPTPAPAPAPAPVPAPAPSPSSGNNPRVPPGETEGSQRVDPPRDYSNMSVEDMVEAILLDCMKEMDKLIRKKAEKIQGMTKELSGIDDDKKFKEQSDSIDQEATDLGRLEKKREHMFNLLQSVLNCYDKTADSCIQAMNR